MSESFEFGKRFNFPENIKFDYDGLTGCVAQDIAVRMAEKYDDFIVSQIAMEARAEGISDLTVLNKWAILNAIKRNIPQKPKEDGWIFCPVCGRDILMDHFKFCPDCGQAIDWEEA